MKLALLKRWGEVPPEWRRGYVRFGRFAFWLLSGVLWCGTSILGGRASAYTVHVWTSEDELPQNSIIAVTQTRDGYLWLGTLAGLVRFDGQQFTVFDENNTPGLPSSQIIKLFEDRQGNLWIGTETAGVVLVKDGQVRKLDIGRGSREGRLASICEDGVGGVWLYTADGRLYRYQNGQLGFVNTGPTAPSKCRVVIAEANLLWFGTDWRMYALGPVSTNAASELSVVEERVVPRLDYLVPSARGGYWRLANGAIQKWARNQAERQLASYPWGLNTAINAACEDREGNLIVGTGGEWVFWFDREGKHVHLSTTNGLSENIVLSLHLDREGSLWVGTDGGGLDRVRPELFRVLEGSEGRVVKSVAEDKDGGLWVGYNFDRIDYWAGDTGRRYSAPQGLVNAQVRCIFVDSAQGVWAGTYGRGLLHLQNGAFVPAPGTGFIPPDRDVTAIFEDRMKRIWVGTQNGLATWDGQRWTAHSVRDGMSANFVRAIAEDLNGNLWIGTEGGGLNRLREGRFTAFTHADGLPSDSVGALYVDKQGVLWIGTSRGLARYGGGQWTSYAASLGPGAASVGYILEDDFGYLWLGSNGGLRRVRKADLNGLAAGTTNPVAVRTYGKPDGMPTRECTQGSQPAACRTRDGRLWFPTIKGLVSVEPALLNRNTNPPPVIIESVSIDGQMKHSAGLRTPALQELAIPAGSESLEIAYTSLNLAAPDKGRFRYRLEGHETGWMAAPSFIRKVRYSKLPPDRYRFVVQACNEDGVWSETGASLAVVVLPPFWRTWWFMSAAAVALLGLVTASVHYISTQKLQKQVEKLRQQEALEQERARIARDIHDQVGASLTQVSLLGEMIESDRNDPEEVAQHARQITQTAVDTTRALDEIVWTVNPSNDTLDGLITYICKYAQDYLAVAGLRYRLDVPPELPSTPVTPELRHNVFLAAKEAITNVVKHARASAVAVRLRVEPGRFSVEIEDDGRGLGGLDPEAAAKRNGLRNMRKRMEDVGGAFAIGPAPERGTVIRLVAPVRNE